MIEDILITIVTLLALPIIVLLWVGVYEMIRDDFYD